MAVGIGSGSVTHGNICAARKMCRTDGWLMAVAVGSGESMYRDNESVGHWSKSPCISGHFSGRGVQNDNRVPSRS